MEDDELDGDKTYTAAEVKAMLAAAAKAKAKTPPADDAKKAKQEAAALREQLQELISGKTLTEDEKAELQAELDRNKSEGQKLRDELQRAQNREKEALTKGTAAEAALTEALISRALLDAATPRAHGKDPSGNAQLIAQILRQNAKLDPATKAVLVEMEIEVDGVKSKQGLDPSKAVELLETKHVDKYGSLFKATAAAGSGSTNEVPKTPNGGADIARIPMAQWAEMRKKQSVAQILGDAGNTLT